MKATVVPRGKRVVPLCTQMCPAGVDVPRHLRHVQAAEYDAALAVLRERIPLPAVCGYACYSPCESRCGHRQYGDPVAIRAMHRIAVERGGNGWRDRLTTAPPSGRRIAVVGAGPCGLTAAYYLAVCGHAVTVMEAQREPGGMLRYGIPGYRLCKEALDEEIGVIAELGVTFQTGTRVDGAGDLLNDGFNAVFLAAGAQKGARLGIPGEDDTAVRDGISFLRAVNQDRKVQLGPRLAIIGGGNSAVDAARSAVRLGAREITVFYRRTREQMTAYAEEVEAAVCEGVAFEFLAVPNRIAPSAAGLAVTFQRMRLGKPDASGRPRPEPVPGDTFERSFDNVITAVGQSTDLGGGMGVAVSDRGLVTAAPPSLATDREGVYAGGDVVAGPASIIDAIAHGRIAAAAIDTFLGGSGRIDQRLTDEPASVEVAPLNRARPARVVMPLLELSDRLVCFEQVERGFTTAEARREAGRCLACDARAYRVTLYPNNCKECGYCREVCELKIFHPSNGFNAKGYRPFEVRQDDRCVGCLKCFYACPDYAIDIAEITAAH